ncbi:MAG TPA: bifunctional diguanylate cyclase/phosphodiesterase [Alphaproteobacteria bacterium]|nr:bifunctional diguanylate cyclase/phosphodiesterase [Alphaproteobacteria bacterium]
MALNVNHRALAALQEFGELQRLRLALSAGDAAIYDWTLADDRIEWSDNAPMVLGVEAFGNLTTGLDLQACLDERFKDIVDTAMANSLVSSQPFQIDYILNLGGGKMIWVEDSGICLKDGAGNAARVIGTMRNITARKQLEERLVYLASYDELTGQLNRVALKDMLDEVVLRAQEAGESAAFLVVAIDHLGIINEDYGYDVADEVILAVAQRIAEIVDSGDVIGRAGGNKFGVILASCDAHGACETAQQILDAMRKSVVRTSTGSISVTVSIGAVTVPDSAEGASEAFARAEEALAQVKQFGRDSFRLYEPSPRKETVRRQNISMANQIIAALEDNRIMVAYQPIICAQTGETVIHECLARMTMPDGDVLGAMDWIPTAERLGLVRQIDRRVAEIAVGVLNDIPDVSLALNVSALTASDGEWIKSFLDLIGSAPQAASRLTVELTETLALRDLEESNRFISRLREAGCQVAIDDFGAGYTSFKNLQQLHIDLVKIDGSFVSKLKDNPENQLFIKTLLSLANNFNVATVAEWVVDEADAELLRSFGVNYLQGFLFGPPKIQPDFLKKK